MHRGTILKAWLLTVLGLVLQAAPAHPDPMAGTILNDITLTEESEYTILQIAFTVPLRYVRHFPYPWGEEIRIQLAALSTGLADDERIFKREVVQDFRADAAPLLEIIYDGQIIGGPYLTIHFDRPMEYLVGQGADFKSLVVVFFKQEASRGELATAEAEPAAVKPQAALKPLP